MQLQIGDIVQLRSGGPLMTIDYIVGQGTDDECLMEEGFKHGDAVCQWFVDGHLCGRCFKASVLIKVEIFSS